MLIESKNFAKGSVQAVFSLQIEHRSPANFDMLPLVANREHIILIRRAFLAYYLVTLLNDHHIPVVTDG